MARQTLDTDDSHDIDTVQESDDTEFEVGTDEGPLLFTQPYLNDLVCDLGLTKDKAELLGSRLRERHLLAPGTTEGVTATFDLFDSSSGPDLTLSPQTFTNSTEAFINDNSNSLGVPAENETVTTTTSEDKKCSASTTADVVKLAVKRPRPKAASPNRQGPQQCQVCAKVFGNASALAKHKLTHSDERKYVCNMCGKAFKRQDHLNGHMLTHRNKKPYECKAEGCGKSYCDARSLRRHTENHHSSSGVSTTTTTTLSPAQGAASGDAASPHGSSCIQYAPPPTSTPSGGKSQLQQLLATEPAKSGSGGSNDGLSKQLDLIHQIMEQTQRQSQAASSKPLVKSVPKSAAKTPTKVQKVWTTTTAHSSPNSKISTNLPSPQAKVTTTTSTAASVNMVAKGQGESKPVECNLCHRKFKNIPALNGHMRLHGGYFKKDSENKKCEKKESNGPPLQTASVSVRALIEEKIINKRITTNPSTSNPSDESSQSAAPPLFPITVHSPSSSSDLDSSKITSFVVPAPPQQTTEKGRRHSDAEAFTASRSSTPQQEAEALAELILKKGKVSVKRTTSDPGQSTQQVIQLQNGESLTLTGVSYQSEDTGGYFSPTLQDEVFTQVQDSMLFQGVDAQHLASISFQADSLLQEQSEEHLQNLTALDEYTSNNNTNVQNCVAQSPASYQSSHAVNQELQAVLDSPLPESLAEFGAFHSSTSIDLPSPGYQTQSPAQYSESPRTSVTAQSPLQSPLVRHDSPGFAYPTPPASHEGQSPCFPQTSVYTTISPKQNDFQVATRDVDEPPQASSPLSAAFFTSTMSSSAAVEEALEEVLPGETISSDDIYPLTNSPNPQSPLTVGLTPVASPLPSVSSQSISSPHPSSTYTTSPNNVVKYRISPHYTLQSQMLPNSEDPLLSSSPKDTKKKFDFNGIPLKVISTNGLIELNNSNFTGILLDSNGELRLIQTNGNTLQTKNVVISNPSNTTQNLDKSCIEQKSQENIHRNSRNIQYITTKQSIPVSNVSYRKEDDGNIFISPAVLPCSPARMTRKRPRTEPLQLPILHQSKLRATRSRPQGCAPYTPPPMLNPSRAGSGLYHSLKVKKETNEDLPNCWTTESIPESDSTPHINIGPKFQTYIPNLQPRRYALEKEQLRENLVWDPNTDSITDSEVDMYLDFACCAAVPGGGQNKEYALHLLNICGGNIHEAMLRLMQVSPTLPSDHPLLHYQYNDSDKWSPEEIETFYQGLLKHDKDFFSISKYIGSKTTKQCVQFYYVWKKVCLEEYKKIKQLREKRNFSQTNNESDFDEKPYPDVKLLGIADTESPITLQDHKNFICEYPDCSASFNSKAALNGHIRIHGGTARNSPTPSLLERRSTPALCHADSPEDYPCKICGKIFFKIKSRSAHMKSHRPPDTDSAKRKDKDSTTSSTELLSSSSFCT